MDVCMVPLGEAHSTVDAEAARDVRANNDNYTPPDTPVPDLNSKPMEEHKQHSASKMNSLHKKGANVKCQKLPKRKGKRLVSYADSRSDTCESSPGTNPADGMQETSTFSPKPSTSNLHRDDSSSDGIGCQRDCPKKWKCFKDYYETWTSEDSDY